MMLPTLISVSSAPGPYFFSALAASGQMTAVPPRSEMNSRRLISPSTLGVTKGYHTILRVVRRFKDNQAMSVASQSATSRHFRAEPTSDIGARRRQVRGSKPVGWIGGEGVIRRREHRAAGGGGGGLGLAAPPRPRRRD